MVRVSGDIGWLHERHDSPGLQSIIAVTCKREAAVRLAKRPDMHVAEHHCGHLQARDRE